MSSMPPRKTLDQRTKAAHVNEPDYGGPLDRAERASVRYLHTEGFTVKELEGIVGRKTRAIKRAINNEGTTKASRNKDTLLDDSALVDPKYNKRAGEPQREFRQRILSGDNAARPPSSGASLSGQSLAHTTGAVNSSTLQRSLPSVDLSSTTRRGSSTSTDDFILVNTPSSAKRPSKRIRVESEESLSPEPEPSSHRSKAPRLGSASVNPSRTAANQSGAADDDRSSSLRSSSSKGVAHTSPLFIPVRSRADMNLPGRDRRSMSSAGSSSVRSMAGASNNRMVAFPPTELSAVPSKDNTTVTRSAESKEEAEDSKALMPGDFLLIKEPDDHGLDAKPSSEPAAAVRSSKTVSEPSQAACRPLLGRANPPVPPPHNDPFTRQSVVPVQTASTSSISPGSSNSSSSNATPGTVAVAPAAVRRTPSSSAPAVSVGASASSVSSISNNEVSVLSKWFSQAAPDMPIGDIDGAIEIIKRLGINTMQHMKSIAKQNDDFQSRFYAEFIKNGGTVYAGQMWLLALSKLQSESAQK